MDIANINLIVDGIRRIVVKDKREEAVNDLFYKLLIKEGFFIVASLHTTEEEIETGRVRPFISTMDEKEYYYIRVFSSYDMAANFAEDIGAIFENGEPLVYKVKNDEIAIIARDYFAIGVDGLLLNDGESSIIITCEEFLKIYFEKVMNNPEMYNPHYVLLVRTIHDIAKERLTVAAPYIYYRGLDEGEIKNGYGELYFNEGELYILDRLFKEEYQLAQFERVQCFNLDIFMFYSIMEEAFIKKVDKIVIKLIDNSIIATPGQILEVLNQGGYAEYSKFKEYIY